MTFQNVSRYLCVEHKRKGKTEEWSSDLGAKVEEIKRYKTLK